MTLDLIHRLAIAVCVAYTIVFFNPFNICNAESIISHTNTIFKDIVVYIDPYTSVDEAIDQQEIINWSKDVEKANAITVVQAATELQTHFQLLGKNVRLLKYDKKKIDNNIVIISRAHLLSNHSNIADNINFNNLGDQGFVIFSHLNSIYISANTRIGLLYGAYEILKKMGFSWYNPNETIVPQKVMEDPDYYKSTKKPFVRFRGFWMFPDDNLPEKYVFWLARNRLNIAGKMKPQLAKKFGIKRWGGGHNLIQEEFSNKKLFKEHPDWYSLYNGKRTPVSPTKQNYVNPAFSNQEAANYFSKKLIGRLDTGDLEFIDLLNVWPSDTRKGIIDQSHLAKLVGNFTDTFLYFNISIAENIKKAYEVGKLTRKVTLCGISYHMTMEPPTNRAVIKKIESLDNYIHIFYPSTRDWSFSIDSETEVSASNEKLRQNINEWKKRANFDFGFVDYNNKSNYAGVGLSDHINFGSNFDFFFDAEGGLYGYMHPLESNPGPLQLTNSLISELCWKDPIESTQKISTEVISTYFRKRYGKYQYKWKHIYDDMMRSVSNVKNIFGSESLSYVLFQNVYWKVPKYTDKSKIAEFISRYRKGGIQDLPNGFYHDKTSWIKTEFIGLDESIRIQALTETKWKTIFDNVKDPIIRERMQKDIEWFKTAKSRYLLMDHCCELLLAKYNDEETENLKEKILKELNFLNTVEVTNDTISPVNQRRFSNVIIQFVNAL
jgi:hypothetical protein